MIIGGNCLIQFRTLLSNFSYRKSKKTKGERFSKVVSRIKISLEYMIQI